MGLTLQFRRALVIEDEADLRAAVERLLRRWCGEVLGAGSAAEGRVLLAAPSPPDLVLLDVRLPDESGFDVIDAAAQLAPAPLILAMSGKASADEGFRLAQRGVRGYLAKPFGLEQLAATLEAAVAETQTLEPLIASCVGRVPMRALQKEVRRVMVREAMARTEGSRSGAARLLSVTRQAVQQILRDGGDPEDGPGIRPGPGGAAS
jgi:DNA-binding NtrC family response regulator